jgi:hypothetical protein
MVVCMASLQRSIHGQKVDCQVEGWQNINDFENVLGGPSMNMIIIDWKGLAPCFADGNPHPYCGCEFSYCYFSIKLLLQYIIL